MKRMLSLLLVVALLLTMTIVPVSAEVTTVQEENITPLSDECPCGCGEKLEDVDWQPLASTIKGSIPEGHHYLTEDINQGDYGLTIIAGTKVVLDLRGFTWTNKYTNHRILTVQGDIHDFAGDFPDDFLSLGGCGGSGEVGCLGGSGVGLLRCGLAAGGEEHHGRQGHGKDLFHDIHPSVFGYLNFPVQK